MRNWFLKNTLLAVLSSSNKTAARPNRSRICVDPFGTRQRMSRHFWRSITRAVGFIDCRSRLPIFRPPGQVIEMSSAWMHGLRAGGVIPCGKHFPGHGDTERDSHLELPVLEKSLDQLRKVELPPFVESCRDDIEALMTAHVRFTALDRELPATLSEAVVTGLLRHQLGYDGVVFSDDMEMKAISA